MKFKMQNLFTLICVLNIFNLKNLVPEAPVQLAFWGKLIVQIAVVALSLILYRKLFENEEVRNKPVLYAFIGISVVLNLLVFVI